MSIYILTQQTFVDEARYRKYEAAFPAVFNKFKGTLLVADESPVVLEGKWKMNKVVLMQFANSTDAKAFSTSPEYLAIQADRVAGTSGSVLLLKSFQAQ